MKKLIDELEECDSTHILSSSYYINSKEYVTFILSLYRSGNLEALNTIDFKAINNLSYLVSSDENNYNLKFKEQAFLYAINTGNTKIVSHLINNFNISKKMINKMFMSLCIKDDLFMVKFFTTSPLLKDSLNLYAMNGMVLKNTAAFSSTGTLEYLLRFDYSDENIKEAFKMACQNENVYNINFLIEKKKNLLDEKILNWLEKNRGCSIRVKSLVKTQLLYNKLEKDIELNNNITTTSRLKI